MVIAALQAALPPDRIRLSGAIEPRFMQDWSLSAPQPPLALLLPRETAEVAKILQICHAHRQPIVPQGGMTGLAGGACPTAQDIALSLERMAGITEIDQAAATLTARAGTRLQAIQDAALAAGFACGIDLGARGSCSIGGNVATNAGGNNVLRYGTTRQNIRGLEVVLADGTVLTGLNKLIKNTTGYDLTQFFIGSEGTLGVITQVVVALHPIPTGISTAFCGVADFDAALAVLRRLERLELLAFEAMWPDFCALASRGGRAAPFTAPLCLLIEAACADAPERLQAALQTLLEDGLLGDAVLAKSEAERRALWAVRELPADYPRLMPDYIGFDIGIPLPRMQATVARIRAALGATPALFYGHVADSNLHVVVDGQAISSHEVEEKIYAITREAGGSISAEHGIGTHKKPYLAHSRSAAEIATMKTIKAALDPHNILNPGKIF